MARLDSSILHEIVHVVQTRARIPERITVLKRQYQLTYLEDHKQRMEEALRRHDPDRLNMLFGQLASKVKYQVLRKVAAPKAKRAATRTSRNRTPTTRRKKRAQAR
ncbi:MAG: hypothetical protein HY270_18700 [Deltaproteobacteria bacterium]|nr:hypothetical protein [Deltaproteobacteria bacterium]